MIAAAATGRLPSSKQQLNMRILASLFSAYNLLASLCLALLTWAVLYYFEMVKGEQSKEFEKSLDASLLETCRDKGFEIYFNFFWIFACIYALAKITELTERYIGDRVKSHIATDAVNSLNTEWEKTLGVYEVDKERLATQIDHLRKKNQKLESVLDEIKACNLELINEHYRKAIEHERELNGLTVMMQQQQSSTNTLNQQQEQTKEHPQQQQQQQPTVPQTSLIKKDLLPTSNPSNIYITNRHFHLTRQVFVNEGNINLNMRKTGGEEIFAEPAQVWVQYMKMRKYYIGSLATPMLYMGDAGKSDPLVVSTEQLQKLQGI